MGVMRLSKLSAGLMALAAASAVGGASRAAAQDEEAAKGEAAPIIVIGMGLEESPGTPAYDTTDLDRQQLISTASGRIEDALASVAGFQSFRRSDSRSANPSAQGATLRALGGNASSRVLVLLDGVPMADPFFGFIPYSAIVPDRLGGARITRGGGSGPFGSGALAGTVELTSADADALGRFDGSLLVDDRGETEASATAATHLGAGLATLAGRWDRGEGFWTTPPEQRVPASAKAAHDSWSAQLRGVAPLNELVELQARGLIYDDRRTLRFEGGDSSSSGEDVSLRIVGHGRWRFDALAYVQARDFSNVVVSSTRFVPVLDQRRTPSTGLGGKIELRPPLGEDNVLRLGLDYRKSQGQLYENALSAVTGAVTARRNAGGTNTDLGLFVEDDWILGPITITAGARADRYTIRDGFFVERDGAGVVRIDETYRDRSGWEGSFRGGAVVRLGGGVQLRAAAYTGLRLPTLNELYRPFVVFPVTTEANAALNNERLVGYEAGVDFAPSDAIKLSLTAFDNWVNDAIANVTIANNLRQRRNIDQIHARGIETSAHLAAGAWQFDGSLVYSDAVAHGSGPAAALDGMRPAQTPQWTGSATLGWRPASNWLLSATLRYLGAQFEDDLQTDVLPAATTFDAYAQIPVTKRLSIVLRGENLANVRVYTRNQGGSIDLGTPRTVWAGFKMSL